MKRVNLVLLSLISIMLASGSPAEAEDAQPFKHHFSGYAKNFNIWTETSGLTPELIDSPFAVREPDEDLFASLNRLRLKLRSIYYHAPDVQLQLRTDYDQQAYFGSFVSSGDFRMARKQVEERQFLDLSQTLVEKDNVFYEHRLYRASVVVSIPDAEIEIGRQQIPWGVGYFFMPTDVFNPFIPTQLELDERDGVDAVNLKYFLPDDTQVQAIYTPPGQRLHPQRIFARVSRDIRAFELGLLGGRIHRDHAFGLDVAGNIKASAVRAEILYREAELEEDFVRFTVNADYNFPNNIYILVEYHYNGQGRGATDGYDRVRLIRGDIQQLGRNYIGLVAGHDFTSLLRGELRSILNADDGSVYVRPELQYELRTNLLLTGGAQLFLGENEDEFGSPKQLFLTEAKYSF